jgi:putative hydrolase of the HAD superfamily
VIPESPVEPVEPVEPQALIVRLRRHAHPLTPIPTDRQARLIRLPDIRAVLFDLYGTLFVSASGDIAGSDGEARGRALGLALEAVGLPVDLNTADQAAVVLVEAITRTHERLKGRGLEYPEVDIRSILREMLEYLRSRGSGGEEPSRSLCEALAVEYECRSNPTWPMPGLAETLRGLREGDISLGIVSNAQFFTPLLFSALFDESLETLGFDPGLCVWSYRLLEAKPSQQLFRRALEPLTRRGIGPERVLYVGNDRVNDIWPAARAGMSTALFAGDSRSFRPREGDPRIRDVREDLLLTDLRQLLDVLGIR